MVGSCTGEIGECIVLGFRYVCQTSRLPDYASQSRLVLVFSKLAHLTYNSRPLYFVRVDVKSCFDTINQEKLLTIMKSVITSEQYALHHYRELNMDQGRVRKKSHNRATAVDDLVPEESFAEQKARTTFHRILVEYIVPTFQDGEAALALLQEHITNNILKVRRFGKVLTSRWENSITDRKWVFRRDQCSRRFCAISFMQTWNGKNFPISQIKMVFYSDLSMTSFLYP